MIRKDLKRAYSFLALAVLLLSGCSDEIPIPTNDITKKTEIRCVTTRSIASFEDDWENIDMVKLDNMENPIYMPWSSYGSVNFTKTVGKDIKKRDGWILLRHSFNSNEHSDLKQPYMIFYNLATGDLKYFTCLLETPLKHSSTFWQLTFNDPQGLMNSHDRVCSPMSHQFGLTGTDDSTWTYTLEDRPPVTPHIKYGWNVLVIPNLVYDSNCPKDLEVVLQTRASDVTYGLMEGSSYGNINGQIYSYQGSNPFSILKQGVATFSGDSAEEFVNKFLSGGTNNTKSGTLLGVVIGSLIKTGANMILDKLFGAFDKTDTIVSDVRLTTHSDIVMSNKEVTPTEDGNIIRRLNLGKNAIGKELGTWNLTENPTVYVHPVGVLCAVPLGVDGGDCSYLFKNSRAVCNVSINPDLLPHVLSYKVTCEPVRYYTKTSRGNDMVPYTSVVSSDFGSLGKLNANSSGTQKNILYQDANYEIWKNETYKATYYGIWNRYGKNPGRVPVYKYFFAPGNDNIKYGGKFGVDPQNAFVKVTMEMEVEFEGKVFTCVETRTYRAKFEWDPDKVFNYTGLSMSAIQGYASSDSSLRDIDNGTYDNLLRSAGNQY